MGGGVKKFLNGVHFDEAGSRLDSRPSSCALCRDWGRNVGASHTNLPHAAIVASPSPFLPGVSSPSLCCRWRDVPEDRKDLLEFFPPITTFGSILEQDDHAACRLIRCRIDLWGIAENVVGIEVEWFSRCDLRSLVEDHLPPIGSSHPYRASERYRILLHMTSRSILH